jgi:hypothetical protein
MGDRPVTWSNSQEVVGAPHTSIIVIVVVILTHIFPLFKFLSFTLNCIFRPYLAVISFDVFSVVISLTLKNKHLFYGLV